MRHGIWVCLLGAVMAFATSPAQAAFKTCVEPPAAATNIAPIPEGRVDNSAPSPVGALLPEGAPGFFGADPPILQPDTRGIYYNIQWGPEQWEEPTRLCALTYQLFDFQPAKDYNPNVIDGKKFPLIVYFHPNGETHRWEIDSPLAQTLADAARENNYHFISVEYRHPVADQYLFEVPPYIIPHDDVGLFLDYLHPKHDYMKIDGRNIFAFGRSRGALALWQVLNAHRVNHPTRQIRGFVGYAAQTSYQCDRFAEQFLKDPGLDNWKTECKSPLENKYDSHFKNAVDEVASNTELHVLLQYKDEFRMDGTEIRKISADFFRTLNFNERLHYPNFGQALYKQYLTFGLGDFMPQPQENVGVQFQGWLNFVNTRKLP